jgi:Response regulator containing CheY-like receiver, AAA-type ATPase, and DNA-binding domains
MLGIITGDLKQMPKTDAPYHVLCVDDEDFLLDISKLFLEREGDFKVDTALSASEGLNKQLDTQYDAIISDYEMPGNEWNRIS